MSFTDFFIRANENLTANANWTACGGADITGLQVQDNAMQHVIGTGTWAAQCPDQGASNHYSFALLGTSVANWGFMLTVRMTDINNFWGVYLNNPDGGFCMYKRVAGSFTKIGAYDFGGTITDGDTIKLDAGADNVFKAYYNGVLRITSSADSFNASETRQGYAAFATAASELQTTGTFMAGVLADGGTGKPHHYYAQMRA